MKKLNLNKPKILSAIKFMFFVIIVILTLKVSPVIANWLQMLDHQTLTNYIVALFIILFGTVLLFPFFDDKEEK